MLKLSPTTAAAIALHAANQSWVMFVQAQLPSDEPGPIKIEGVRGTSLLPRLQALTEDSPVTLYLIGLILAPLPHELAAQLRREFEEAELHGSWFEPTEQLRALIETNGTAAMQELLSITHPGGIDDDVIGIEELAQRLGVAVVTIRRAIKAEQIPYLKLGRTYRFVYSDVVATLSRR